MQIPYWIIVPIVVCPLMFKYVSSPNNSYRSKKIVAGIAGMAILVALVVPVVGIVGWLVLVGVGVYLVLHRDLKSSS
jgi:hypothetical protein